jgi:hypothetical protein
VHVQQPEDIPAALDGVSIGRGTPVLVLIGGAGGMDDDVVRMWEKVLLDAVLPVVRTHHAAVVDGGTDSGVMRAIGRARSAAGASFPLVGVAARGTLPLSSTPPTAGTASADKNHTHLVLVPGSEWGDESPWLADVADVIAEGRPSVTLLVNGGDIAFDDADRSLSRGRPVVVLAGTGRTADLIADAAARQSTHPRAQYIARSDLTIFVPVGDPSAIRTVLARALEHGSRSAGRASPVPRPTEAG